MIYLLLKNFLQNLISKSSLFNYSMLLLKLKNTKKKKMIVKYKMTRNNIIHDIIDILFNLCGHHSIEDKEKIKKNPCDNSLCTIKRKNKKDVWITYLKEVLPDEWNVECWVPDWTKPRCVPVFAFGYFPEWVARYAWQAFVDNNFTLPYPKAFGEPPKILLRDFKPLPFFYPDDSTTIRNWLENKAAALYGSNYQMEFNQFWGSQESESFYTNKFVNLGKPSTYAYGFQPPEEDAFTSQAIVNYNNNRVVINETDQGILYKAPEGGYQVLSPLIYHCNR